MTCIVSIAPIVDISVLEREWLALESCSECSYFQTWRWIGAWVSEVAYAHSPAVIRVVDKEKLVAIGIITKPAFRQKRRHFERTIFLNELPIPKHDMTIEYNGLLIKNGQEKGVYKAVVSHLRSQDKKWDSLKITRIRATMTESFLDEIGPEFYTAISGKTKSWQYVSPASKFTVDDLIKGLSKNRRHQIKRALSIHQKDGDVSVREAKNLAEAHAFFEKLEIFHTERWEAKGEAGSFKNGVWRRFHLVLITAGFKLGEVQLLEVSTPNSILGYIYNFIWRNRVYVLQTGFNTSLERNSQPGYISHIKAIVFNHDKGNFIYDLLCEDSGYKKTLCNQSEDIVSLTFKLKTVRSILRLTSPSSLKDGYLVNVLRFFVTGKRK